MCIIASCEKEEAERKGREICRPRLGPNAGLKVL